MYFATGKVFQVPNVELDALGFLKVLMNASDSMACLDLCKIVTMSTRLAISHPMKLTTILPCFSGFLKTTRCPMLTTSKVECY